MPNAIEHFSRCRVENTTLQVMADMQRGLDRLIHEEQSVIRRYVRLGNWPHKWVNMFVLEDLQPLVSQIKGATALSSVVANDIDRRPMVNVYDAADLAECAVFVNRSALKREAVWNDEVALRAMLAHEHGHPLAENDTVRAARALAVEVVAEKRASKTTIGPVLQLLADRLCVHAPQEVFANEVAIRADFADALFHLDNSVIDKAKRGVSRRPSLVQNLEQQAAECKLSAEQAAGLLLVGDLQAHLPFALETAPFLRAGRRRHAEALEAALIDRVLIHLDPAALRLYGKFRDHYLELGTNLTAAQTKDWSGVALGFLGEALRERSLETKFTLVPARSAQAPAEQEPPQRSTMARAAAAHGRIGRQGRSS
jgi:hypothetical protein